MSPSRKAASPSKGSSHGPAEPKLGRRERNKLKRRQDIKGAARATFLEKGYSGATTREIADRAGIAEGTLFLYWKDKRDLLLAIVNDDLDEVASEAFSKVSESDSLLELLTKVFVPRYAYWAAQPKLFSAAVYATMLARALNEQTPETIRYDERQQELMDGLTRLVAQQQRAGSVRHGVRPRDVSRLLMAIYLSEFRMWVVDAPSDVKKGIRQLRKSFELAIQGIRSNV